MDWKPRPEAHARAGTGAPITAHMVVVVRSKGLYGGLNLTGSVISVDDAANSAFYGHQVLPVDILVKRSAATAAGNGLAQEVARTAATTGQ